MEKKWFYLTSYGRHGDVISSYTKCDVFYESDETLPAKARNFKGKHANLSITELGADGKRLIREDLLQKALKT